MTDRPILFTAPMIRALLEGRKTQTRRVIKNRGALPDYRGPRGCERDPAMWGWEDGATGEHIALVAAVQGDPVWNGGFAVGDRLWVKEGWSGALSFDRVKPRDLPRTAIFYEADGAKSFEDFAPGKSRSSRFMPRWASRLTLVVTKVRVQRVQDISEEDAKAEGISVFPLQDADDPSAWWQSAPGENQSRTARGSFHSLWDSLNAKRGFGWDTNPWVVAVSFDVHCANIDQLGDRRGLLPAPCWQVMPC